MSWRRRPWAEALFVLACLAAGSQGLPRYAAAQEPPPPPQPEGEPCWELRLNPAPCDCPPFELRQGDHWARLWIDDRSDQGSLAESLRHEAERSQREGVLRSWLVQGRLLDQERRCAQGHLHAVFVLQGRCAALPQEEPALPPASPPPPAEAPASPPADPPADLRPEPPPVLPTEPAPTAAAHAAELPGAPLQAAQPR